MIDFSMLCFCRNRSAVTCWIGWPDILMKLPHVAVHRGRGRKISIKWFGRPLRVDDCVYFHPETTSKVKIRFQSKSIKILVPA